MALEYVGKKQVIVRDYTNNFAIKEYIQNELIPAAYPDIEMNKLNLGLIGIVSEMISQGIEDASGTASLMMNEAFITKAMLPESIYTNAALFGLTHANATPSRCKFAMHVWEEDIMSHSRAVESTSKSRFILDKDTKVILGDYGYRLDYDINIDSQEVDGNTVYTIYYDTSETNSLSFVSNKYIRHHKVDGWIVLFIELQQFDRTISTHSITDNLVTVNSDITIKWTNQLAGIDLKYVTPTGEKLDMTMKNSTLDPEQDPFVYYSFINDNTLNLTFSNNSGYFMPAFNSKIEASLYTSSGADANFDSYDDKNSLPVIKCSDNYEYNGSTRILALCYSGSVGGLDRGDIELLRQDTIMAYNTANALSTDNDLKLWFERNAVRYNSKSQFFKRRDDFSGRLFSQFVAIMNDSYLYPTNTLSIEVKSSQFDFVLSNSVTGVNEEFIIKPGHLWEYDDYYDDDGNKVIVRDRVRMVTGIASDSATINDSAIPGITDDRPFMFVNPFFIKIHKSPTIVANYNYLINDTSQPDDTGIDSETAYQFHITTTNISRTLTSDNVYTIQAICLPVSTNESIDYVEGINSDDDDVPNKYPIENNNLRLVLVTKSRADGETGYIEMTPIEERNSNAILFEVEIPVLDNLCYDMMIDIDMENSAMKSLISTGDRSGRVVIDSSETMFDFIVMFKDNMGISTTNLFNDDNYAGYIMANRYSNSFRDLTLYDPMNMMRSNVIFAGSNDDYTIRTEMIPLLKYTSALDEDEMLHFIQAFNDQYRAMEPVINQLEGNSSIDFKLVNSYGRSANYYVGPDGDSTSLWDSEILLDDVHVKINLMMCVFDRSIYNQTVTSVTNDIINYFDSMTNGDNPDIHISDIIHLIIDNQPNVRFLRFTGFNEYDANKQSIFVKYDSISEMREDQLHCYVPEIVRVDAESITIIEEIYS